jgi:solute carrier family 25 iron transporter 28/37
MTIPLTAVQFTVYEHTKKLLNPSGQYSPVTHMIAGGIAGAVARGCYDAIRCSKDIVTNKGDGTGTGDAGM